MRRYPRMTAQRSKPLNPYALTFTPRNAPPPPSALLPPFPPPPPPPYVLPYYYYYFSYYSAFHYQNPHMDYRLTASDFIPRPHPHPHPHPHPQPHPHHKNKSINSARDTNYYKYQVVPLKRDEHNTTIMIKNIPYDCHRKELIKVLDNFCLAENDKAKNEGASSTKQIFTYYAYDFIYLPIDFRTKRGRGFAFVNFTNARAVWKFFDAFHHKHWHFVHTEQSSSKKIEIVSAKLQGKEALVEHFRGSVFECETDEFLPAIFRPPRDGSGQPVEVTVVGKRTQPPLKAAARYNRWKRFSEIRNDAIAAVE